MPQPRRSRRSPLERYVRAGEAVAGRHVARRTGRRAGRARRAGSAAQDARAAALALDLFPRLHGLRRDDQRVEGVARAARPSISRWRGPRSSPSRSRSTARANGCCGCRAKSTANGRTKSNAFTSRTPSAARCACRARSAARSTARSATPARSVWCATSRAGEIVGQVMVARDRLGDWVGANADERPKARSSPTSS